MSNASKHKESINFNWIIYFAGLFLECPGITSESLRSTLQLITSPIQSLSVYDFDRSVTSLTQDLFTSTSKNNNNNANIRHLQFSHSNLQQLKDNSLQNLRSNLESLSIVNGKLTQVSRAFIDMYIHLFQQYIIHNTWNIKLCKFQKKAKMLKICLDKFYAWIALLEKKS